MKKLILLFLLFLTMITISGCVQETTTMNTNLNPDYCITTNIEGTYICEKTVTSYFDTTISLKLYYRDTDTYNVDTIFTYFINTLEIYHQYYDKYHAYAGINNVYTINNSDTSVVLDDLLYDSIQFALDNQDLIIYEDTKLFNIALDPVLEIWHDARESSACDSGVEIGISYCPVPRSLIDGIEFNTDPDDINLNPENNSISFNKTDMAIDLGGFGKGYVTKVISDQLNEADIVYILNAGNSNVIANGENPFNEFGEFVIALTKPSISFNLTTEYYQYIQIPDNMAVVTSGLYQRFFKETGSGDIYHHIIDPRTNYPGGYSMSVTILYPDSALADLLSTAIYLLPLEEALGFVNSTENLEAIWYGLDETITYSDGFSEYIYILE